MQEQKKFYTVLKQPTDPKDFTADAVWQNVSPLIIDQYLWMKNGYTPEVRVRIFHTKKYIYLRYRVAESSVTIRHTAFGSDVWEDSCVEFFLNPFPEQSRDYFNMEFNAMGVALIGVGNTGDNSKRHYFGKKDVRGVKIVSSITRPVVGSHGSDHWWLYLRLPKALFEKHYKLPFTDKNAIGNFYKCGDKTQFEHYGAWNPIVNETPNFHLPEQFGRLVFSPAYTMTLGTE